MSKSKKTMLAAVCATLMLAMTSCHKGTGCPTWSKVKYEQSKKKSV